MSIHWLQTAGFGQGTLNTTDELDGLIARLRFRASELPKIACRRGLGKSTLKDENTRPQLSYFFE